MAADGAIDTGGEGSSAAQAFWWEGGDTDVWDARVYVNVLYCEMYCILRLKGVAYSTIQ